MEMTYRRMLKYPPVYNLMVVLVVSEEYELAREASEELKGIIDCNSKEALGMRVIGPSDATIAKINDIYRRVIYIKTENTKKIIDIQNIIDNYDKDRVSVMLDVNPVNMY